jgi:HD-GYP domain-containing protein (c-di-GMP phosphodiesterase class II)
MGMRRISIERLNEGMVLAKTIYSIDGNILLNAGIKLKESYINKFREIGIGEIYINDNISSDIVIEDVVSDETRFEARMAVKKAMDSVMSGNNMDAKPVRNIVSKIVEELLTVKDAVINLQDIKTLDSYTFAHSANVCVLATVTGISMGYDANKLKELSLGALLHDIGKTRIPNEILNKPGPLTDEEYEIIKRHTRYGYDMLKESVDISAYTSYIALTHHEKYNGEGYPLGLKGKAIHEFSRIVSVADVFDAMTSNRVYRKRLNISEVVEYLISLGHHHFDYDIVRKMVEHISVFPLGSYITLSTGETAIVVDNNKKYPNRPVVRIIKDPNGVVYRSFNEVDLASYNNITITDVLDDI